MRYLFAIVSLLGLTSASTCLETPSKSLTIEQKQTAGLQKAYFASGCFWCVEAVFESVEGVGEVISGYAGGTRKNPTYEQVSSGATSHAEAVEVYYDSTKVSYQTLLAVFFDSHDPTTLNRQGPDAGPQYRSAIFYQNDRERSQIEQFIKDLEEKKVFSRKITTEVGPLTRFWEAEDYHQDYEAKHPNNPYIRAVSIPRLRKFQAKHPELLKDSSH